MIADELRSLIRVLETDRALAEVVRKRQATEREVAAKAEKLAADETALARLADEMKRLKLSIRDREQQADDAKRKMRELESKRDNASSARMLAALESDLKASAQVQEDAETSALEQMEALDTHHAAQAELEAKVTANREALEQAKQSAQVKLAELAAEHAELSGKRDDALGEVPAKVREQYERLRSSYPQDPLASVDNDGICEGCSTKLPPDVLRRARGVKEWVVCPNCSRLVYDPAAVTAASGNTSEGA